MLVANGYQFLSRIYGADNGKSKLAAHFEEFHPFVQLFLCTSD